MTFTLIDLISSVWKAKHFLCVLVAGCVSKQNFFLPHTIVNGNKFNMVHWKKKGLFTAFSWWNYPWWQQNSNKLYSFSHLLWLKPYIYTVPCTILWYYIKTLRVYIISPLIIEHADALCETGKSFLTLAFIKPVLSALLRIITA